MAKITALFPPGDRLAKEMDRAGLTQVQLSAETGVPQSSISAFKNGKRPHMDCWAVNSLCKRLNITAEYLLDGTHSAEGEEAEAVALLRHADPALRAAAMAALRGMLGGASRKQASTGHVAAIYYLPSAGCEDSPRLSVGSPPSS